MNVPKYLNPNCPDCGEKLVLADSLDQTEDNYFLDEWACPSCYDGDGVYIDFDPEFEAELKRRIKSIEDGTAKLIPWEDVKKRLFKHLKNCDDTIEENQDNIEYKDRGILNFK